MKRSVAEVFTANPEGRVWADWYLEQVWHKGTEVPKWGLQVVVVSINASTPVTTFETNMETWNYVWPTINRWAYIKDLLPKTIRQ